MDTLSKLFGWLTGNWDNQSTIGKGLLSCVVLIIMACVCGLPLLVLYFFPTQ
jgi:hypothetical protein